MPNSVLGAQVLSISQQLSQISVIYLALNNENLKVECIKFG